MSLSKYDEILLGIMKETGHIIPFLDAVFGFLYKCTDFYRIQEDPADKLGFPEGIAEKCVLNVLHKWEQLARQDEQEFNKSMGKMEIRGLTIEELDQTPSNNVEPKSETKEQSQESSCRRIEGSAGDSYNGAIRDNYKWAQTITDLDIQVPVPEHIIKARDVQVIVTATHMSVAAKGRDSGDWTILMEGDLRWRNNKDESLWSLEPRKHVQIHLEKSQERWWDSLLVSEPKLDLSKIDATRPMEELAQDEQMKIQELLWNQERKQQGLPTSDQLAMEKVLKEAWDKEGSPFLGTEYDPSIVQFNDGCVVDGGEIPYSNL